MVFCFRNSSRPLSSPPTPPPPLPPPPPTVPPPLYACWGYPKAYDYHKITYSLSYRSHPQTTSAEKKKSKISESNFLEDLCSSLLSIGVIKHWPKASWKERVSLASVSWPQSCHWGKSRQELNQEQKLRVWGAACWLARLSFSLKYF